MSEEPAPGITERIELLDLAIKELADLLTDLPDLGEAVTPEDDVDLEDLKGTLAVACEFISNQVAQRTFTHAPARLRGRQPLTESFLRSLYSAAKNIRSYLVGQENLNLVSWETSGIRNGVSQALERSGRKEFAFLTVPEQAELDSFVETISGRMRGLDEKSELKSATKRAREAAASAEQSASKASSAAGVTADSAMSKFYETLGDEEQETANLFRRWAIGLGSVAGAMAWVFLSGPGWGPDWLNIAAGDYVHLIQRGLVLAAFLALAGYLARQAHQHRTMANWARSLAVQLKTFDAFIDAIEDGSVRDELRKQFAGRVFGDHPAVKGEPAISASSQSVSALTDVISKVVPAGK